MRDVRISFAMWSALLLVALSLVFSSRAAAFSVPEVDPPAGSYWTYEVRPTANTRYDGPETMVFGSLAAAVSFIENIQYTWEASTELHCHQFYLNWYSSGAHSRAAIRRGWIGATCTGNATSSTMTVHRVAQGGECPPELCPPEFECPAAETTLGERFLPSGSSGGYCNQAPGQAAGVGCAVNLHGLRSYKDAQGQWMTAYEVRTTGSTCVAQPGDATFELAENSPATTCTVVSGNVHCWDYSDTDCQYVNGEKWCFSDVDIADLVITQSGQVLATDSSLVTDDAGNPLAPSSEVARPGPDGETPDMTVGHWNGGNVGSATTGIAIPNPAQGGRVPGSGTGDGDGEGDGGGSLSGGLDCSASPVCDGDPVLCGVVEQQWRLRCHELATDAEIAAAAGEDPGTTLGSVLSEMQEGDGSGWSVQSTFSDYLSAQGGDWWARSGGACVTDPTISLPASFGVGELTIELSRWCVVLAMLGQLILGLAWLQALRIFVGAL